MKKIYIILTLIFFSCSKQETPETILNPTGVRLTSQQETFNEIETGLLSKGPVFHRVSAVGKVELPPNYSVSLSTPISAFVGEIYILPGSKVKKGQKLVKLTHPSIVKAQEEFLSLSAANEFLTEEFERKKRLVEGNGVSIKELQLTKSELVSNQAQLTTVKENLNRLNIRWENVKLESLRNYAWLLAPFDGIVTELNVKKGDLIPDGEHAISVISREHEHIELEVFQKDINKVRDGQPVKIRLPESDKSYDGEVFLVNGELNGQSGSANIHVHPSEAFPDVPNKSVVFSEILYQIDTVFVISSNELIRQGNEFFIFIKDQDLYQKVKVNTGFNDGDYTEVKGPDHLFSSQVVLKGNYALNGF